MTSNQSSTSTNLSEQLDAAVSAIQARTTLQPKIGIILGSGLSAVANAVENGRIIPTADLPHWPTSTVSGHHGRLVIGTLEGQPVLVMQGRVHFYEGYSIQQVTFPVRVMHKLGIRTLVVTNAAGGINSAFSAGDIMLINDHINFPGMAGHNPLRGPNDESIGPRFPDMTAPYDPELRQLVHSVAAELGFELQEGVYTFLSGPTYETPAELRFLRAIGADAVGMSTVPSVIVARHAGMRVLGMSTITNMVHLEAKPGAVTEHAEVLEIGKQVIPKLEGLLRGLLSQL